MAFFEVELCGEAREVYLVEARDAQDAAERWADAGEPVVSEATSMEVVSVARVQE